MLSPTKVETRHAIKHDVLHDTSVGTLVAHKSDLIDIEAHESVLSALSVMQNNQISAIPVYGAKRHWIAAGGIVATHEGGRTSHDSKDHSNRVYIGILSVRNPLL
jgi:predicted transcriptional regulator